MRDCACVERVLFVYVVIECGHCYQFAVPGDDIVSLHLRDDGHGLHAIHDGHVDIHEDQLDLAFFFSARVFLHNFDCLFAVVRNFDLNILKEPQKTLQSDDVEAGVIHNENLGDAPEDALQNLQILVLVLYLRAGRLGAAQMAADRYQDITLDFVIENVRQRVVGAMALIPELEVILR